MTDHQKLPSRKGRVLPALLGLALLAAPASEAGPDRTINGKAFSEWTALLMSADEDTSGQARDVLLSANLTEAEFHDLLDHVVAFLEDKKGYPYLAVGENLVWIISAMGDQGGAGLPFIRRMADAPYESEAVQMARGLFGKLDQPLDVSELGAIEPPAKGRYTGLDAADIDGDGRDEIILAGSTPDGLFFQVVCAASTGVQTAWEFNAGAPLALLYAGDVNDDGRSELCCRPQADGDRAVIYTLNTGPGPYLQPLVKPTGYRGVRFGVVTDIDRDRKPEVLEFMEAQPPSQASVPCDIRICRWNADRERLGEILPRFKGPEGVKKVCCGDIDGDRQPDIVCESGPDAAGGEVAVIFRRKGGFTLSEREHLSHDDDQRPFLAMVCFDVDQDRKDELVKLEDSGYYVYQWDGARFKEAGRRWYDGAAADCRLLRVRSQGKPDRLLLAYTKNNSGRAWSFREIRNLLPPQPASRGPEPGTPRPPGRKGRR